MNFFQRFALTKAVLRIDFFRSALPAQSSLAVVRLTGPPRRRAVPHQKCSTPCGKAPLPETSGVASEWKLSCEELREWTQCDARDDPRPQLCLPPAVPYVRQ